jgi:hypothetical protein
LPRARSIYVGEQLIGHVRLLTRLLSQKFQIIPKSPTRGDSDELFDGVTASAEDLRAIFVKSRRPEWSLRLRAVVELVLDDRAERSIVRIPRCSPLNVMMKSAHF